MGEIAKRRGAGGIGQLVECLPSMKEALGSILQQLLNWTLLVNTCNPSIWKAEAP